MSPEAVTGLRRATSASSWLSVQRCHTVPKDVLRSMGGCGSAWESETGVRLHSCCESCPPPGVPARGLVSCLKTLAVYPGHPPDLGVFSSPISSQPLPHPPSARVASAAHLTSVRLPVGLRRGWNAQLTARVSAGSMQELPSVRLTQALL